MFCPNCGKTLPNNINFCAYCGEPITDEVRACIERNISKNVSTEQKNLEEKTISCPNCGNKLPNDMSICAYCGEPISGKVRTCIEQDISEDVSSQQASNDIQEALPEITAEEFESNFSTFEESQFKNSKLVIGICISLAFIVMVAGIFIVRYKNEQVMIQRIPWMIYDDQTQNDIKAFYKDYIGESIMTGCSVEDFSVKPGADSNTFNVTGVLEVTDISQSSRPTYSVTVTGTVATDFFRNKYTVNYTLQYQIPENSYGITYPPELPPIDPNDEYADFRSPYFGRYINQEGYVLDVGETSSPSGYYVHIYENLDAYTNSQLPILELWPGQAVNSGGSLIVTFGGVQNAAYLVRNDDSEGNYTFVLSGYYGGVNLAPYSQSIYYMFERGVDFTIE